MGLGSVRSTYRNPTAIEAQSALIKPYRILQALILNWILTKALSPTAQNPKTRKKLKIVSTEFLNTVSNHGKGIP